MGQNHNVIHCSWHRTRSRFKNWFKKPRSMVIGLTVIAAMCNIWLAHPPNTCLCNGYEEKSHVSTQFYFLALFKMEQTLEYLSHGKFQYCNICFCRLKILHNSCFVCLWKKKIMSYRNVEVLLSISLWMLQLWEWQSHFHHTSCLLRSYSPPGCKAP